jgi:hypothetical protein
MSDFSVQARPISISGAAPGTSMIRLRDLLRQPDSITTSATHAEAYARLVRTSVHKGPRMLVAAAVLLALHDARQPGRQNKQVETVVAQTMH